MTPDFAELAARALREAAFDAGLPMSGWTPVRIGERAVFRHAERGLIGKVERSPWHFAGSHREIAAARWLRTCGIPAEEPLDLAQPTLNALLPVTFWHGIAGSRTTPDQLAAALKPLHALPAPADLALPRLDPLRSMRWQLGSAAGIPPRTLLFLADLLDERERDFAGLFPEGPDGSRAPDVPLHGDAHIGNILLAAEGRPTLFDLGGLCLGPRQWDLMTTAVYRDLGWHGDAEHQGFCDVYGVDVTRDPAYPALRALQELRMVCWLAQKASENEVLAAEFALRVRDLAAPDRPRRWTPY